MQDALENLTAKKVSIFGVSTDTVESQMTFAKKEALQYSLISDIDKKVTKAFKVPLLMNKLAKRQAYLFKDGILVWRDTSASTKNQGDKLLDAIKENS